MTKLFKKITAILLITFLISLPATAAIHKQNMAGTTIAGAGALTVFLGIATGTAIAMTGGLALGLVGAAILIDNALDNNSTPSSSAISIQLNPNVPLITPPGWTSPVSPSKNPTPPFISGFNNPITGLSTSSAYQIWVTGTITAYATAQTMDGTCQQMIGKPVGDYAITTATLSGTTCTVSFQLNTSGAIASTPLSVGSTACPVGYTVGGTDPNKTCNLTSPTSVIKPVSGAHQIVRTGNTFSTDPQINPKDKLPSTIVNVSNNTVTVNDSSGNTTTVTLNSDGTSSAVVTRANADGTSLKATTKFTAPNGQGNVEVTGTIAETVNGIGTATGATPITNNTSASPTLDISSLNKESTQNQIKNQQCGYDAQHPCKIDEGDTQTTTQGLENSKGAKLGQIDGIFDDIINKANNQTGGVGQGMQSPLTHTIPSGGACVNPSFDATTVHPMAKAELRICEHANEVQPILKWSTYIFTLFACWGVLFRKVGGT